MNTVFTFGKLALAAAAVLVAAHNAELIPGGDKLTVAGVDTRPYIAGALALGALYFVGKAVPVAATVKPAV